MLILWSIRFPREKYPKLLWVNVQLNTSLNKRFGKAVSFQNPKPPTITWARHVLHATIPLVNERKDWHNHQEMNSCAQACYLPLSWLALFVNCWRLTTWRAHEALPNQLNLTRRAPSNEELAELNHHLDKLNVNDLLRWAHDQFPPSSLVDVTSFGPTGLVLLHHLYSNSTL